MPKAANSERALEVSSGVVVHVYRDVVCDGIIPQQGKPFYTFCDYGAIYSAEDLSSRVARELNIGSLSFYLFALASKEDPSLWLPPNAEIPCEEDTALHYVFRLRFLPPQQKVKQLGDTDPEAFKYFFLQCRHDFVNDKIPYKDGDLSQDRSLGLGVIDMVRFGRENNKDLAFITTKLKPKLFIPVREKHIFRNILEKKRLNMNFRPQIEKEYLDCVKDSLTHIKIRYIYHGLLSNAPQYGMEQFDVQGEETMCVEPHSQTNPGLYSIKGTATVHVRLAPIYIYTCI